MRAEECSIYRVIDAEVKIRMLLIRDMDRLVTRPCCHHLNSWPCIGYLGQQKLESFWKKAQSDQSHTIDKHKLQPITSSFAFRYLKTSMSQLQKKPAKVS